ncbi:MAG: hypothetical protein ACREBC_30705 [Pyrinomonadaceae bacterium]
MGSSIHVVDAWRIAQEPDAILEAIVTGQQISDFISQARSEVERACHEMTPIIEHTHRQCQGILEQLAREARRIAPVLTRLQAINEAVA